MQKQSHPTKTEILVTDTNGRNLKVDRKHLHLTSYHGHDPLTKRPVHSFQTFDMDGQIGIGTKNSLGSGVAIAATDAEINAFAIQWLQAKGCRILGKDSKDLSCA